MFARRTEYRDGDRSRLLPSASAPFGPGAHFARHVVGETRETRRGRAANNRERSPENAIGARPPSPYLSSSRTHQKRLIITPSSNKYFTFRTQLPSHCRTRRARSTYTPVLLSLLLCRRRRRRRRTRRHVPFRFGNRVSQQQGAATGTRGQCWRTRLKGNRRPLS